MNTYGQTLRLFARAKTTVYVFPCTFYSKQLPLAVVDRIMESCPVRHYHAFLKVSGSFAGDFQRGQDFSPKWVLILAKSLK